MVILYSRVRKRVADCAICSEAFMAGIQLEAMSVPVAATRPSCRMEKVPTPIIRISTSAKAAASLVPTDSRFSMFVPVAL